MSAVAFSYEEALAAIEARGLRPVKSGGGVKCYCPIHGGKSRALNVTRAADGSPLFFCHGEGCNADFPTIASALGFPANGNGQMHRAIPSPRPRPVPPVPAYTATASLADQVERWQGALTDEHIRFLREARGLSNDAIAQAKIGHDDERYTIPIYDLSGNLLFVKRYLPGGDPKFLQPQGVTAQLYLADRLHALEDGALLVVAEGELDALLLSDRGIPAVSSTGGAGHWGPAWPEIVKRFEVVVVGDADEKGQAMNSKVVTAIRGAGGSARALTWPEGTPNKTDPTDFLVSQGHTIQEFRALLGDDARETTPATPVEVPDVLAPGAHSTDKGEYVEVGVDDFSESVVAKLPAGTLYRRGNSVGTLEAAKGKPIAAKGTLEYQEATDARVRNVADACIRTVSWASVGRGNDKRQTLVYRNCSRDYASLIRDAALRSSSIRQVEVIAHYPVFYGSPPRLAAPGWNENSGIYYHEPDDLKDLTPIRNVDRIQGTLDDLVVDFPFEVKDGKAASKHNYFGFLLTPMLVPAIDGNIPQHHFGASIERTGKGKLAGETTGYIYHGAPIAPTIWPGDEAEREKRIVSLLRRGENFLLIDNLDATRELDSATLALLLTARQYTGRLLGGNEMPTFPNNMTITSTGNNTRFSAEIVKRMLLVKLVPKSDHPEDRDDFVHPDLAGHVLSVRRDVLSALIGMVENWKAAGCPLHPRPLGGFERWSRIIGGILGLHGFSDWRANERAFHREANPDGADLELLVAEWAERWPREKKRAGELLELSKDLGTFPHVLLAKTDAGMAASFSKTVLRPRIDRPVGRWAIRSTGSGNTSLYYLDEN